MSEKILSAVHIKFAAFVNIKKMSKNSQLANLGDMFNTWLCLTIAYHTCSAIYTREQENMNDDWVAKNTILKTDQYQILKLK